MNGDRALFPLFTKTVPPEEPNNAASIDEHASEVESVAGVREDHNQRKKAFRPRNSRKKQMPGQKTLQEIVNPTATLNGHTGTEKSDSLHSEPPQEDASPRRSKRRRVSRTESIGAGGQDDGDAGNTLPSVQRHRSPQAVINASSPLPTIPTMPVDKDERTRMTPKKMLRLKSGGKFSSPVSNKPKDEVSPSENVKRRVRHRKWKVTNKDHHVVAIMRYNAATELGMRINRILTGEERFKKQVKIVPKGQNTPHKAAAASAHPFFSLDRCKEPGPPTKQSSPRKTSAVTPGKLRRQTLNFGHAQRKTDLSEVWTSTLLKDRLMFKHPGAKEPAWPDREQTHVRGLTLSRREKLDSDQMWLKTSQRKHKAVQRSTSGSDCLLNHFASQLRPEEAGKLVPDGFREPHPSLRLPKRLLISGQRIASEVVKQVSVPLADSHADEILLAGSSKQSVHQALQATYNKIPAVLSAFDEGRGETATWSQKYAPVSCNEALQPAPAMKVLKDWLSSLTISAVENTSRFDAKFSSKPSPKPKKRKPRRHDNDLDDFLVDSDEEIRAMDEMINSEDVPLDSKGRKAASSMVQVAADGVKLNNAVLISGPHGCGKTAAAYAAAKDLGFKVFEISSSERRSGKDVLDKVGDMTENHLVKHHGTSGGEHSPIEEPSARLDEAFSRDLASGRQGKMASFFKPQAKVKSKPNVATPHEAMKTKSIELIKEALKKPPKDQQQSLILLEEVDILFKEDREFWSTVLKLMASSKRPFIMTCNDEDLVPLQAMSLHAILRFSPPPQELATDYLLLVAAAEGHLLDRSAVSSLYMSKGSDLRAAITELNAWCQIGVGDPRAGLSWLYQRYPPGSDIDGHGLRLRVVSKGTYKSGMGLLPHDGLTTSDKLQWAWYQRGIDVTEGLGWSRLTDTNINVSLSQFSQLANDLSATDVYGRATCAPRLDTSQKPLENKIRAHCIEGLSLLQTDEESDYVGTGEGLWTDSTLLAFKARGLLKSEDFQCEVERLATSKCAERATPLTRHAFACFDGIAIPTEPTISAVSGLQQSVFDGPFVHIATDIAPYVRSIVQFDLALSEQREALAGEKSVKRARTTRAARSALEGGQRAGTRRERWFPRELDLDAVLATGGKSWPRLPGGGGDDAADGGGSQSALGSSVESDGLE